MNLDNLLKYLMWIAFFIMASAGIYFTLKKIGIL